ncbi:uncharacterized protein LOC124815585 [Hydra vulgaris]|uniref:uncharacterized protein LOC124815585 n=1 Tax=Hydra vulgaris TaxID=6087 RepID=UPI001F5EDE90|nr:uncharacterized protein LOC124815585 [Hydra vulgaris]
MKDMTIVLITFCIIGIFLNGFALMVLITFKTGYDLTQRYILLQLCFSDLGMSIIVVVEVLLFYFANYLNAKYILNNIIVIKVIKRVVVTVFYYSTFWLVLDRFLHIKLNIKYVVYCSKKKILITVSVLWVIAIVFGSLTRIYIKNYNTNIIAFYDIVIIIFSTFVYAYALIIYQKQNAIVRSNQHNKGIFKGLLLTSIILTIFFAMVALPDILYAIHQYSPIITKNLHWYIDVTFPLSFWTDAIVYIFCSPRVRRLLKNKLKCIQDQSSTLSRSTIMNFSTLNNKINSSIKSSCVNSLDM